jgi:hypothetical protein
MLAATALGTATLGSSAHAWTVQDRGIRLPPAYLADLDGDGKIGKGDLRTLRAALGSRRGFEIRPAQDYDPRADFFARLRVGVPELDAIRMLRRLGEPLGEQPITVAWHYGWYHPKHRPPSTAGFLGGIYGSADPEVEDEFNRLRNEFGISVDALCWISPRVNARTLNAYKRGYMKAQRLGSRHTCLLYESSINLGDGSDRVSFIPEATRNALIIDFEQMAHFLAQARDDSPARVFEIGGRPVIFAYASHIWGTIDSMGTELQIIDEVVAAARHRFAQVYGAPPYLVGEEMLLGTRDQFNLDRWRRSRNFDGVFVYHHVTGDTLKHGGTLGVDYARGTQTLIQDTLTAVSSLTNRFTGEPLRMFPSLAAGFAKQGLPRLWASRSTYREFLTAMDQYCRRECFGHDLSIRSETPGLLPVYTVGSWNEEAEGHALFPARFNLSLKRFQYGGFDLALALKETFGWNTYARKRINLVA